MGQSVRIINEIQSCADTIDRMWIKTVASTATPERVTGFSVSSITVAQTTVNGVPVYTATATTAAAHWLMAGDTVVISGANETYFNGNNILVESATPNTTTFTYIIYPVPLSTAAATGTIVGYAHVYARACTVYGKTTAQGAANAATAFLGPLATNGTQADEIFGGSQFVMSIPTGTKKDLADVYIDIGTNAAGLVFTFC